MILPSAFRELESSLLEDFQEHGRLGLIPLAAYFVAWIPANYRLGRGLFTQGHAVNLTLCGIALLGFRAKDARVRGGAAIAFFVLFFWATFFAWDPDPFW